MKRTTIYLDADLEAQLKMETLRRKRPMAELIREAVQEYLVRGKPAPPPGAGSGPPARDLAAGRTRRRFDVDST